MFIVIVELNSVIIYGYPLGEETIVITHIHLRTVLKKTAGERVILKFRAHAKTAASLCSLDGEQKETESFY